MWYKCIYFTNSNTKKKGRKKKRKKFFLALHFMSSATFCTPRKKWQVVRLVINLYTIKRVGSLLRLVLILTVCLIGMKSKKIENEIEKKMGWIKVFHPIQVAFVPNRKGIDNVVIAQELFYTLDRKKGRKVLGHM